jgi:hypothetical protein
MSAQKQEATHTPTPWTAFADGYRGHEIQSHQSGFKSVGYVSGARDAEFIVKAANSHEQLVAACLTAVEFINESNEREVTLEEAVDARNILLAALESAKGKQ